MGGRIRLRKKENHRGHWGTGKILPALRGEPDALHNAKLGAELTELKLIACS